MQVYENYTKSQSSTKLRQCLYVGLGNKLHETGDSDGGEFLINYFKELMIRVSETTLTNRKEFIKELGNK